MAWGLSLIGTKASINADLIRKAVAQAVAQANVGPGMRSRAENEFHHIDAVKAFLGKLVPSIPDSQQLTISASGDLVGDRGEIRVVVTVSPAPPPAPVAAVPDAASQPDGTDPATLTAKAASAARWPDL